MCRAATVCSFLTAFTIPPAAFAGYLQAPDPNGWAVSSYGLWDDWLSPFTGPVTEIKIWLAGRSDQPITTAGILYAANYSWLNGSSAAVTGTFHPDVCDQAFYSIPGGYQLHDHRGLWEISFKPTVAPIVNKGQLDTIFLEIQNSSSVDVGWSSSTTVVGQPARYETFRGTQGTLTNPITGQPMDLAFEILPEPAAIAMLAVGGALLIGRSG